MELPIVILWTFRFGAMLLVLGLLLPDATRKTILSKVLGRKPTQFYGKLGKSGRLISFFEQMSENPSLRPFMLDYGSEDYNRMDDMISRAGGLYGITPNTVQLFRLILPPVAFVVLLSGYLVKASVQTVTVNPTQVQQIGSAVNGFVSSSSNISVATTSNPINMTTVMFIFFLSMALFMLPEMYIKQHIKVRNRQIKKELPIMETFVIIMLESNTHTVYEILKTLLDTTNFFRPYITMCLNEFYVDPAKAIQNMADRVGDEEFQVICNGLKQAVDVDKRYTATFMRQHLDQIRKLQELQREAKIKKKPMIYVFVLALPLVNCMLIWFYPWFIKAMDMLRVGF